MMERDNQTWLLHLNSPDPERSAAIGDLRSLLLANVRSAWAGRMGCVDDALLEDAVQNSLVQILQKLGSFHGRAGFPTWATTVTMHAIISEMRRRRWRDVSLADAIGQTGSRIDPADGAATPEVLADRSDLLATLNRLIQEDLTQRQTEAILAELNGLPLQEIARRMGTNRNAVYKLTHDARRKLKAGLEAAGYIAEDITNLWASPTGGRTP